MAIKSKRLRIPKIVRISVIGLTVVLMLALPLPAAKGYDVGGKTSKAAYAAGHTTSSKFPTTAGAYDKWHNGDDHTFVVKYLASQNAASPTGSEFLVNTFVAFDSQAQGTWSSLLLATIVWDGGGADSNWTTEANWVGDVAPGAGDVAVFDGTSIEDVTINTSINVAGIDINAGYSGTITQGSGNTITIGSSNYDQAAGTFVGSADAITLNGDFTMSGGTFNAGAQTITITEGDWTYTAGTLDAGTSTVVFGGSWAVDQIITGSHTLNNVTFDQNDSANYEWEIGAGTTLTVSGTLTIDNSSTGGSRFDGGTIAAQGNVTVGFGKWNYGTTILSFTGSGIQTFDLTGATDQFDLNTEVNKSGGYVNLASALTMNEGGQDLTMTAGILEMAGFDLAINDVLTLESGTMICKGGGTLAYGSLVDNGGAIVSAPWITARETVDDDGDGQIDQIKITTDQALDDDFAGLTMTVAGYTVDSYVTNIGAGGANDNVFYVKLQESGSADTEATPTVKVTANTTLSDFGGTDNIGTDDWWDFGWQNRRKVTFDNSASAENLSNFPILVSLTSSEIDYSKTQDQGQDIRFVDADGTTLSYEIEEWDEAGTSTVWVNIPQIDAGSTTDYIWMYYNNSGVLDAQSADAVWDSTYVGAWHLKESGDGTAGEFADSSGTGNPGQGGGGTAGSVPTQITTGKIGNAQQFDGTDDYVDVAQQDYFKQAPITVMAWVSFDQLPSVKGEQEFIISKGHIGSPWYSWALYGDNDGDLLVFRIMDSSQNEHYVYSDSAITTGTWYQVIATVNASYDMRLYLNGVQQVKTANSGSIFNSDDDLSIGAYNAGDSRLDGKLDEVRVSNTARSADWVEAQYLSQNNSLATYGSEQVLGVGTTDAAAPVLLSATGTHAGTAGLFNGAGDQLDLVFSEAVQAVPNEGDSETNFLFSGADGDNFPTEVGGDTIIELATTTVANDTIRYTFSTGDTANVNLITAGSTTIDVNVGGMVANSIEDAAGNDLLDTSTGLPLTISSSNEAPTVSAVALYETNHTTTVTAMTPQIEYAVKVTITDPITWMT